MESSKLDEEKLREASCYGDLESVRTLLQKGININSRHSINGWTALHWAAKRNHLDVAHFLVTHGADTMAESLAKEIPADLTTSPAILNLLGSPKMGFKAEEKSEGASITPHYLSHPSLGYTPVDTERKSLPSVPSSHSKHEGVLSTPNELVFKVRIAYSFDSDFIEVEMDRAELTYPQLMSVCCTELGINPKYVERLRKLPNTRLRRDRDVQRLKDYEEIEVVLVGSKPKSAGAEVAETAPNIVGPAIKNQAIFY